MFTLLNPKFSETKITQFSTLFLQFCRKNELKSKNETTEGLLLKNTFVTILSTPKNFVKIKEKYANKETKVQKFMLEISVPEVKALKTLKPYLIFVEHRIPLETLWGPVPHQSSQ